MSIKDQLNSSFNKKVRQIAIMNYKIIKILRENEKIRVKTFQQNQVLDKNREFILKNT